MALALCLGLGAPPPSVAQQTAGAACQALLAEVGKDPIRAPLSEWADANRTRIATLLPPEDAGRYAAAIAAGRCQAGEALIKARFQQAFPQMACLFAPPSRQGDNPERTWRIYIATYVYPDLGLCFAEQELGAARAIFAKANVPPPVADILRPFRDAERDFGKMAEAASDIDQAVRNIDGICRHERYLPACVVYARLANEGVVVKVSDDRIYFQLVVTKLRGFDNAERATLEATVAARMTPEARGEMEALAQRALTETVPLPR